MVHWKNAVRKSVPILLCVGLTGLVLGILLHSVDLKPKVDESFFFSKHDPQLKADNKIVRMFPDPPQIVLAVAGDIDSDVYIQRLQRLTNDLEHTPGVVSVTSLANGPKNLKDARKSRLWTRLLIANHETSSYMIVTLKVDPEERTIRDIEALQKKFERDGFRIMISGVPYVTELIGRSLTEDLRVFSLAAICVFGVVLIAIFRSAWVVIGTVLTCANSSAATLILADRAHIPIGPLTANLSTMVFVMTLSPMVFLTFNWKRIRQDREMDGAEAVRAAVRETIAPSFWSCVCMLLGFLSLLFVASTPMKHLGIAGSVGAAMAFAAAYTLYPWFLVPAGTPRSFGWARALQARISQFTGERHWAIAAFLLVFTFVGGIGLMRLNTDPTLPSYFKLGSEIRRGLDFIDRAGGSSPLKIVIEDRQRAPLDDKEAYKRLWDLQESIEKDPAVGSVLSLPVVLSEAKRPWYSFLFSTEKEIKALEKPKHEEIARRLITPDRIKTLFMLRMRESARQASRAAVIHRIEGRVERRGFRVVLVGGTYSLLEQMARLISSSIVTGVLLLISIFVIMGFAFSRSIRVAAAMLASLAIIPVVVRGYIAFFGMPLDFITSAAANLDLGMGVDAMIYLTLAAKRNGDLRSWPPWSQACSHLWQPIVTSLLVLCCGFGIFLLSNFPPTQRFGVFVIFGSATAASSALFLFPWLATLELRRKQRAEVVRMPARAA